MKSCKVNLTRMLWVWKARWEGAEFSMLSVFWVQLLSNDAQSSTHYHTFFCNQHHHHSHYLCHSLVMLPYLLSIKANHSHCQFFFESDFSSGVGWFHIGGNIGIATLGWGRGQGFSLLPGCTLLPGDVSPPLGWAGMPHSFPTSNLNPQFSLGPQLVARPGLNNP